MRLRAVLCLLACVKSLTNFVSEVSGKREISLTDAKSQNKVYLHHRKMFSHFWAPRSGFVLPAPIEAGATG